MIEVQTLQKILDSKDSEQAIEGLSKELEALRAENQARSAENSELQQEKHSLLSELEETIDQLKLAKQDLETQKANYGQLWKICEQKDAELKSRDRELA